MGSDLLIRIHDKLLAKEQPCMWARLIEGAWTVALKCSSYRNQPLMGVVIQEIRIRVLAMVQQHGSRQGLGPAQIGEITRKVEEWRRGPQCKLPFHDAFLSWVADGEANNLHFDWTLPIALAILKEYGLRGGHFDGTEKWPARMPPSAEQPRITSSWHEEMCGMVGLQGVKDEVCRLRDFLRVRQVRQQRGLPLSELSLHQVFLGNPGTGKTTIARILARIYHEYGFLQNPEITETDRSGLVGSVIGATEAKTNEVIRSALGGVLFIDEAYSLATESQQDFGQRAIDTLVKAMEDQRGQLVVIVAGYEKEMRRFFASNPGLASRFNRSIRFEDYEDKELFEIYRRMAEKDQCSLGAGMAAKVQGALKKRRLRMGERFGNARDARTLWEMTLQQQAYRLCAHHGDASIPTSDLLYIAPEDLPPDF